MIATITSHEYADWFPMMSDADLQGLAKDISANGQQEPIITFENQILDGRNRYRACEIAGVDPVLTEYNGNDPLQYVISHNLHRRHMTDSQRAVVAAKWAQLKVGANQHKEGPPTGEPSAKKTRDEAAKLMDVGTSSIDRAKRVMSKAPELVKKIESGEMTVSAAHKQVIEQERQAEPETLVVDGTKGGQGEKPVTRRSIKVIESNGKAIFASAKCVMDRLSKTDTQREQALRAMICYCTNKQKPGKNGAHPTSKTHELSAEAKARGAEAERESENLWMLKSIWKKTNKTDRATFIEWTRATNVVVPNRKSPVGIIESEGMRIWMLAKTHLDRINRHDEFWESALTEARTYCDKRLESNK